MKQLLIAGLICAASFLPHPLRAQVEVLPEAEKSRLEAQLPDLLKISGMPLKNHLRRAAKRSRTAKINAIRVAEDARSVNSAAADKLLYYAVAPTSETQYLPDAYPFDGEAYAPIRIIAALEEYEPGSFVVYPLEDLGKVQFEVSDLKSESGAVFSKSDLDLKTVKVWYQCGNGWYSYFSDPGLKLCPELLLNDEDLVKVDTEKTLNYARLTAKNGKVSHRLLTVPKDMDFDFSCMVPEFQDAPKHCGATLHEGEFKQFFLTAHVKKGQKPGLYQGSVSLKRNGVLLTDIPVQLRVLPFVLPEPRCYNDVSQKYRDFMSSYISLPNIRHLNGNDAELAEKQLMYILNNMVAHNEVIPDYYEAVSHPEYAKAAGMDLSAFIAGSMLLANPAEMRFDARRKVEILTKKFGTHRNHYLDWGDEFGYKLLLAIRPMIDIYKKEGFKYANNSQNGYAFAMYLIDFYRVPVTPDFSSNRLAEKVGKLGDQQYFGWYAVHHVGVENPAFCRRQYGLAPYRAGFSCNRNYAHHLNGWNDLGGYYKPMNFFYGDGKGVIDTIAWEGYREGIDDIRYATLIQQLAKPLLDAENYKAKYAARKAMLYLADLNTDDFDLSTARLEMIRHILALQQFSK